MEHKAWLWRKKSSEKTIVMTNKAVSPSKNVEREIHTSLTNEVASERSDRNLNEKLASVLLDCSAKDDFTTKQDRISQEAIAGQEKAEEDLMILRKELDAMRKRLSDTDAALKQCNQQLSHVETEQENRIHDAILKKSIEYENAHKRLEEKLKETSMQVSNLAIENTNLSNVLLSKEKIIEDLQKRKSQVDAEFDALMTRLDSTEKENAFLKYEFRMLEKELEIRNEELEYNRRSADVSRKQHIDGVKKITMLEAECQKLRQLLRKRLPGPAASANIKSEVEFPRRRQNPTRDLIVRATNADKSTEIPSKQISIMIERMRTVEEENKDLRESITKKTNELNSSRIMYARTASRLSQMEMENRPGELYKDKNPRELVRSMSSCYDISSDDGINSSGSWASALLSELENFRNGKLNNIHEQKGIDVRDMSFRDDFVEMAKLAIVSVETPSGNGYDLDKIGKDLVPVSKDVLTEKSFDWLQVVLNAMLEQKRISNRSMEELFGDIKIALGYINQTGAHNSNTAVSRHNGESDRIQVSGYIGWKSPNTSLIKDPPSVVSNIDISMHAKSSPNLEFNLSESICKITKLVEGINSTCLVNNNIQDNCSQNSKSDLFVRVFQWKNSELTTILKHFVQTCNDLLNGKADFGKFAEELTFALEWITNNYVTLDDASSARDKIKKHFGFKESPTEKEQGVSDSIAELNRVKILEKEIAKLKDELKNMESAKTEMEDKLHSAKEESKVLSFKLHDSEKRTESLLPELENLKDQIENQKLLNKDLDTQLMVAKTKLNEVFHKFSSLEVKLEDKSNCCEELESTCLELQLQLESIVKKESPKNSTNQEERQSQTGWEITSASAKLAECQETILSLGKQLKALASPREKPLFDKVFSTINSQSTTTAIRQNPIKRASLRDRMLAEDDGKPQVLLSPDTRKGPEHSLEAKEKGIMTGAIVPSKKLGGFSFWRKLLLRRKNGNSKKNQILSQAMTWKR